MFQDKKKDFPNFSDIIIHGLTNYRKSSVEDHARIKKGNTKHPHTVAYNKYLSTKNNELKSRSKTLAETVNKQNTSFVSSFGSMSEQTFLKLKIKFETTYFAVQNELSIFACKKCFETRRKARCSSRKYLLNDSSIGVFIDYTGDDKRNRTNIFKTENKV